MVKVVPNSATRLSLRALSSRRSASTMLISGSRVRGVSWAMQMCGVTAGSTAASAPAGPVRR